LLTPDAHQSPLTPNPTPPQMARLQRLYRERAQQGGVTSGDRGAGGGGFGAPAPGRQAFSQKDLDDIYE